MEYRGYEINALVTTEVQVELDDEGKPCDYNGELQFEGQPTRYYATDGDEWLDDYETIEEIKKAIDLEIEAN